MREVHTASVALAKTHRQPAFVIAPSRLHDIESKNKIPSIHRLYALALIYRRTMNELLSLYGDSVSGVFQPSGFVPSNSMMRSLAENQLERIASL